jgi:hypothetical protein
VRGDEPHRAQGVDAMSEGIPTNLGGDRHSMIADVVETPLDVLLDSDDSTLNHAIRRILCEIRTQREHFAAHTSSTG